MEKRERAKSGPKPGSHQKRVLSPKAKLVLEETIRDPDQTDAAIGRKVGIHPVNVNRILHRDSTQEIMRELMENDPELKPFLSRKALLFKLKEGLDSTQKQRFAFEGKVKTEKTDPDYRARGFYLSLAADITGAKSQKLEVSGPGGAPLIPDALSKIIESMPEVTLILLLKKLSTLE